MSHTTVAQKKNSTLPVWDLSDLYPNKDSDVLKRDLEKSEKKAAKFKSDYQGKLATLSGDELAAVIKTFEALEDTLGRISSFAFLLYAQDMTHEENVRFFQNTSEHINEISLELLFFTLELNKISDSKLNEKLKSKKLSHYASWIRDVRAARKYQLDDNIEEILHEKHQTSCQSWVRLFDDTLASMRFDFGSKKVSLTELMDKLSASDEATRKKASKALGKGLTDNAKTFALITNVLAKDKDMEDRWRGFELPISSRNLDNLIEDEVVETLISTVKQNYPNLSHRYYKLKTKWLGKKKLDYWNRNAPLPGHDDTLIKWDDAVALILDAYGQFSPELARIGKQFFDNPWIHAQVNDGKDSGAFAHPTVPSAHPYLLVNFQGKTRDVMTLAHELGHGVHQVLAGKQGALMADTPLTLAETASVFGEQLTFRALLKMQNDPIKKRNMLASKVEDMLNTVVRQIAFCEFEQQVHANRKVGELSKEQLASIWMDVQKQSLGPALKFDKDYEHFWAYIPHFIHSPFYVYAYAFGDCLVNSLYRVYQEQPKGFEQKYLTMLSAGGTLRHKELLAPFGLDATNPNFWQGGLDVISGFIDELEKM